MISNGRREGVASGSLPLRFIPPTALRLWAPPVHEATGGHGPLRQHPPASLTQMTAGIAASFIAYSLRPFSSFNCVE